MDLLYQKNLGVQPDEVLCGENYGLVLSSDRERSVFLTDMTAEKFISRGGWVTLN